MYTNSISKCFCDLKKCCLLFPLYCHFSKFSHSVSKSNNLTLSFSNGKKMALDFFTTNTNANCSEALTAHYFGESIFTSTDATEARLVTFCMFVSREALYLLFPRLPMSLIIFPWMEQGKDPGNMKHK